jgi:hypothetical protein
MLLAALFAVFLVMLGLTIAAPRVAMQLKHEQELETQHRANQYVRAIRVYYRKIGHYPGSVEQLLNTNNQQFLRQKYLDPLTGKDDWRLITVGQNKTTVKGFFGQDLPGIGGGLGAVAGMASSTSGSSSGSGPGVGASGILGASNPSGATNSTGTSGTSGTTGTSGSSGSGDQGGNGIGGSGGPIMGVGVPKSGQGFLSVNGEDQYENWEFLYDPRIEQLYAKGNLLGGGGSMSGGLGNGTTNPLGNGPNNGFPGSPTPSPGAPVNPNPPVTPAPGGSPSPQ